MSFTIVDNNNKFTSLYFFHWKIQYLLYSICMRRVLLVIMMLWYFLGTSMLFHTFAMWHTHNHTHTQHSHQTATMYLAHDASSQYVWCSDFKADESVCVDIANQDTIIYYTYVPLSKPTVYYYWTLPHQDKQTLSFHQWHNYQKNHPPQFSINNIATIRLLI